MARRPIMGSVEDRVFDTVCSTLGVNRRFVTRETRFQEDLGADSLDIVELMMHLEEMFEITITDAQADQIRKVGEAIDFIGRKTAELRVPSRGPTRLAG
jgi:acyl carrier protein